MFHADIELVEKDKDYSVCCHCGFCGVQGTLVKQEIDFYKRLGDGVFYCAFCIRHGFHNERGKNVLILDFSKLIGQLYANFYTTRKMWQSQIYDLIKEQVRRGRKNPAFLYDPQSQLWFIDFSKVGQSSRKIRLEEILDTAKSILDCLSLTQFYKDIKYDKLWGKYEDAITRFYECRYRPKSRFVLSPSLKGCVSSSTPVVKHIDPMNWV